MIFNPPQLSNAQRVPNPCVADRNIDTLCLSAVSGWMCHIIIRHPLCGVYELCDSCCTFSHEPWSLLFKKYIYYYNNPFKLESWADDGAKWNIGGTLETWMFVPNCMTMHSIIVKKLHKIDTNSSRVVVRVHPLGTMNVCTKLCGNASNVWDISVSTKEVISYC